MTRRWSVLFLVILLATLVRATVLAADPVVDWTRQFGTMRDEYASDVGVDHDGRITAVGTTYGTLPDHATKGSSDAFVRVYRPDGTVARTRQFGTVRDDGASAVAVDATGRVYVAGGTRGTFSGQVGHGRWDGFVRKYRPRGTVAWTRQFGREGDDHVTGIAVDGRGRVYVTGSTGATLPGPTSDAFVRAYRPDGSVAWTRRFGTRKADYVEGIAVDGRGRIAVAGTTYGTFAGQRRRGRGDAFVRVYRADGSVAWTRQFGTGGLDGIEGIAFDGTGRIAVAGSTGGTFPGQIRERGYDGLVRVYRADGSVAWTRQFGTRMWDEAHGIAVGETGDIVVAGSTGGTFPGQTSEGDTDAFVRTYHPDGSVAWTRQFGTSGYDDAFGTAVDGAGRIAVAGVTDGTLPGQTSEGGLDAFVRSYIQP